MTKRNEFNYKEILLANIVGNIDDLANVFFWMLSLCFAFNFIKGELICYKDWVNLIWILSTIVCIVCPTKKEMLQIIKRSRKCR